MLPSELLSIRRWKKFIRPKFASINSRNIAIVKEILTIYQRNIGNKKREIQADLLALENLAGNYKFIRGIATLIERKCKFASNVSLNPVEVRRTVFSISAEQGIPLTSEEREKILQQAAERMGVSSQEIEATLYADLDSEKVLVSIGEFLPEELIRQYNLSLAQTLLFSCTKLAFSVTRNWQKIFRAIKFHGLIYTISKFGSKILVEVDGPLSLFKLSRRYGTALAKLLPEIVSQPFWEINAQILYKKTNELLTFNLNSTRHAWLFPKRQIIESYDSSVEEDFANRFKALKTGWTITREPEPIITGTTVMLPDFAFAKGKNKIYLEIVGFWTKEYLRKKIEKLKELQNVPMILAVNEELACEKLERIPGVNLFYYKKRIPLEPIIETLNKLEKQMIAEETATFSIRVTEPIITVKELAQKTGLLEKTIIKNKEKIPTHILVGEAFIEKTILQQIRRKLQENLADKETPLMEVIDLLHEYHLPDPVSVLRFCGFKILWRGISPADAVVIKEQK